MGYAIGYIKCLLLMFLSTFLISGVALLVLGSLVFQDVIIYNQVGDFVESKYKGVLITILVIGSLIILISAFGVVSILKENNRMIIALATMIFILFISEIAVSSICFLRSNDIGSNIADKMFGSLGKYTTDSNIRHAYDAMQRKLECCGVERPLDYVMIFMNASVPASCCVKDEGFMCAQSISGQVIHMTGCHSGITRYITWAGVSLGSVTLSFAFIGIIGVVLSGLLVISLSDEDKMMTEVMRKSSSMLTVKSEPAQEEEEVLVSRDVL